VRVAGVVEVGGGVRLIELPRPRRLASDEVLIEVKAAGVGNWDEFVRAGGWDVGARPPMALGVEASGVITALGDDVAEWSIGDEVMTHPVPLRDQGAWSEQLIAGSDVLASKPESVSWEEAAAFPVPALTAYQALAEALGPDARNDRLLVHGAGGVTGRLVVELARLRGIAVIATAGPRSADALRSLGVDAVLDYHDDRWGQVVRELTQGAGVTAAVNAARGEERRVLATVADRGRLATITGSPPGPERDVAIADVYVRADGQQLRHLAAALGRHELGLSIGAVYGLPQASEALELASRGAGGGAVVLTLGSARTIRGPIRDSRER
jgi:NADPH:quinone reductase-like Zn-dependent oxidoreductase